MAIVSSAFISVAVFAVLLTTIQGKTSLAVKQTRADVCPNPEDNACLFGFCDNGGTCIEDPTILECYRCQCPPGYTGRLCDSLVVITPTNCSPTCVNGGTCINSMCICPSGYNGLYCQQRDYCAPTNPCSNGGRCYSGSDSFVCDCSNTGYTGNTCATPVVTDPCLSSPCLNSGLCYPNGVSFVCTCVSGFTGSNCQIPPIPCAANPCENGGSCELISTNIYGCKCLAGFTGTRCETSIVANHVCVLNPAAVCQNGGTCIINNADYICKCATGWTGTNCQTRDASSTCNPSPCGAYGTCIEMPVQGSPVAFCSCADRWTGKYCDVNMDTGCPVGFCLSGGTCRMAGNTPYCDCPVGFTGQRCETVIGVLTTTTTPVIPLTTTTTTTTIAPINLCASLPCKNGGTCLSDNIMFMCNCAFPWTGRTCETDQMTTTTTEAPLGSTCNQDTCQNGGTCYVTAQDAFCSCPWPWGGLRCSDRIDLLTTTTTTTTPGPENPCSTFICSNGGTCVPIGVSAVCNCPMGYSGTRCEMPYTTTTQSSLTCANSPCRNGGTCVPRDTSYSCFCGTNSVYTGKNCDSTEPMPVEECPLNCAPGRCVFSGNAQKPYACLWNGIMRPTGGTTA